LRPVKTLYFDGLVFDAVTKKPLAGKFQLIDVQTGKEIIKAEADQVNGSFTVSLPLNKEYALNVSYDGYSFYSKNFNMTNPTGAESVHMDVPMFPISNDAAIRLDNVFFDLAKATLRKESYVELNKLRDFLKSNAALKIEIGGHTDTRGVDIENQLLSQNRAKAVYDYLVSQGIDAKRMTYKGYGETLPQISDLSIAKLDVAKQEAAHQSNRRTEYKIIK
jgi:outer membrane protein OmpA-like peptidoglycan-associated protein